MMFLRKQSEEKPIETEEKLKLTKAQLLKQKRLERKEKALAKRQLLLKQHFARELQYGSHTCRKYEKNWKQLLTQLSLDFHKENFEFLWQSFERVMDMKDFIISCRMDEMRKAEDQCVMSIRMHVAQVDKLMDRFHDEMKQMRDRFMWNVHSLKKQHQDFFNSLDKSCGGSMIHLKSMLFAMEMNAKTRERDLRADLSSKVDAETNEYRGTTLEMTERLTSLLDFMWRNTNDSIDNFLRKTREHRMDYDTVLEADRKVQEVISKELNKIQRLNEVILKLKKREEEIGNNELANLKEDKEFFQKAFLVLKLKLADDLKFDKAKQEYFIQEFYDAHDEMKELLKRGEKMIRLLGATKRMETSVEKVKPYPVSKELLYGNHDKILFFWQRIGQANASRVSLLEQRNSLRKENELLRRKLAEICQCTSCPKPLYQH